jgi:hypothetical protein
MSKTQRRNALASWGYSVNSSSDTAIPWEGSNHVDQPLDSPQKNDTQSVTSAIPSVMDIISSQPECKKRKRDWDLNNPATRFRKVDPALLLAIVNISDTFDIPRSDVARAFMEFGLDCYEKGLIKFEPSFEGSRQTLYPKGIDGSPTWRYVPGGLGNEKKPTKKKVKKNKGSFLDNEKDEDKADWEKGATWRLPNQLIEKLTNLAKALQVPIGEVINVLGKTSLEVYNKGEFILNSKPSFPNRNYMSREK